MSNSLKSDPKVFYDAVDKLVEKVMNGADVLYASDFQEVTNGAMCFGLSPRAEMISILQTFSLPKDFRHCGDIDYIRATLRRRLLGMMSDRFYIYPYSFSAGLRPRRMWRNGPYTTVLWDDGTKTTVKAEIDDGTDFGGFSAAVVKKLYGTTTEAMSIMDYALNGRRRMHEERKQLLKEHKRRAHEQRIREREQAIKAKMDLLRIEKEARKRLEQEEDETP